MTEQDVQLPRAEVLRHLTRLGCFAADMAVIYHRGTEAEKTAIAIETALHELERQGFIRFTPRDGRASITVEFGGGGESPDSLNKSGGGGGATSTGVWVRPS